MIPAGYYISRDLGPQDQSCDWEIASVDKAPIGPNECVELLVFLESPIGQTFKHVRWIRLSLDFAE